MSRPLRREISTPAVAAPVDLASDIHLVAGTVGGRLRVSTDDPYYFDHPLDHVPGTALLGGLLDIVRTTGAGNPEKPGSRMSLSVEFTSFCELDGPVDLLVTRHSGIPALTLRVQQSDRVVCAGTVAFEQAAVPGGDRAARQLTQLPADQTLVHRSRPENILVTGMATRGDARVVAVRRAPAGHRLATARGEPLRAEAVLDAARQFCTMVSHLEHGSTAETRFVMLGIQADVPGGLGDDVYLRWRPTPGKRGRSHWDGEVVVGSADGERCGTIGFDYYTATPAVYARLRGEVRA